MGDSNNDIASSPTGERHLEHSSTSEKTELDPQLTSKNKHTSKIKYYRDSTLADIFLKYCEIKSKTDKSPQDLRFEKSFDETTKKDIVKALKEYETLAQEKEELIRKQQLSSSANVDKLGKLLEENKELLSEIEQKSILINSQEETITNLNAEIEELNIKIANSSKTKKLKSKSKTQTDEKDDSDSSIAGEDEPEEETLPKQTLTQTSSDTLNVSTPVKHIRYNEKQAENLNLEALVVIYTKLLNQKKAKSTQEATKFKLKLIEKSKKLDQEINTMRSKIIQLQKDMSILQTKQQNEELEEKENKQIKELRKLNQNLDTEIKKLKDSNNKLLQDKLDLNDMLNNIANREAKVNDNLMNAQEEILQKNKLINEYIKEIEELKDKLKSIPETSSEESLNTKLDHLSDKLQESAILINKLLNQNQILLNRSETQQNSNMTTDTLQNKPQYSEIVIDHTKNLSTISESAILIKRRKNTKISMAYLKNFLHKETKDLPNLPKLICANTRDKDVLLLKSDTDDEIDKLLNILDGLDSLKELAEITYKSENRKRIIILGVPVTIESDEIIDKIKETTQLNNEIEIVKTLKRDKAHTYQIILDLNYKIAQYLLNKGRLLLGFNSCKILLFKPVIRCNNCQKYGHTGTNCRRREVCQFCAKLHKSSTCPVKDDNRRHRCSNCLNTDYDNAHPAFSSECPVYQYFIQQRNNSTNYNRPFSRL